MWSGMLLQGREQMCLHSLDEITALFHKHVDTSSLRNRLPNDRIDLAHAVVGAHLYNISLKLS